MLAQAADIIDITLQNKLTSRWIADTNIPAMPVLM